MNAKVHDTIGVSPAELVFEKSINLYTWLLLPVPPVLEGRLNLVGKFEIK
jgi:hypothetical protein